MPGSALGRCHHSREAVREVAAGVGDLNEKGKLLGRGVGEGHGLKQASRAGLVAGGTAYFNRRFGIQGEYSRFFNDPDYCFSAVQGGPVFRFPMGRLVPFTHVLGSGLNLACAPSMPRLAVAPGQQPGTSPD